jgi:hypothetical protein
MVRFLMTFLLPLVLLTGIGAVAAQDTGVDIPTAYSLNGVTHIYQTWNNCGPATVTMGLTFFGAPADQQPAATWLKPNSEDKNVSPWQIAEYVNTQVPGTTRALIRQGGTLDLIKQFIARDIPIMIEAGYDPPSDPQGWMGHYLLVTGYDDAAQTLTTQDSFDGPNLAYTYDYIDEFWRHFNRVYIVLYEYSREAEVMALLGEDADEATNWERALAMAQAEASANQEDPFAWFNVGTGFVGTGQYDLAARAYDFAFNVGGGLPFRMLWYQFGPFEAYYNVGRYDDMVRLAQALLNDGGGQYVEETYYYGGLARLGLGETERARSNFDQAIFFNPNFTPAREALTTMGA